MNKIYVSKAEIKHTSFKVIITIYVYNRERFVLLSRIQRFYIRIVNRVKRTIKIESLFKKLLYFYIYQNKLSKSLGLCFTKYANLDSNIFTKLITTMPKINRNYQKLNQFDSSRLRRSINVLSKILTLIRRLQLKFSLNKYKFEELFLSKLSNIISKQYGDKKVEFNIVNLKSFTLNGDIFTQILRKKLDVLHHSPTRNMNALLGRIKLPKENTVIERARFETNIDLEQVDNKFKNLHLSSILSKIACVYGHNSFAFRLNKLLSNLCPASDFATKPSQDAEGNSSIISMRSPAMLYEVRQPEHSIQNILLDNIKYKKIGGAKLRVKGRLTRRYRADRAVFKLI